MSFVLELDIDDKNSHSLEIIVKSPSDKKIAPSFERSIDSLEGKKRKVGVVLEIGSLKISEEGKYNIETIVDSKPLKISSFIVTVQKK